jgi:hypothetical protein
LTCPGVMHGCETVFVAQGETFPDAVFGGYEVGEAFAYLGEAHEGCYVADGDLLEDFDDDFLRNTGDRTWWRGREVGWRGLPLDRESGEVADEVC